MRRIEDSTIQVRVLSVPQKAKEYFTTHNSCVVQFHFCHVIKNKLMETCFVVVPHSNKECCEALQKFIKILSCFGRNNNIKLVLLGVSVGHYCMKFY